MNHANMNVNYTYHCIFCSRDFNTMREREVHYYESHKDLLNNLRYMFLALDSGV